MALKKVLIPRLVGDKFSSLSAGTTIHIEIL